MGNDAENSFQNIEVYRYGRGNEKKVYFQRRSSTPKTPRIVQTVIRTVKTIELGDTSDHLLMVWNGFDVEFQQHIEEPSKVTTFNVFPQSFDRRKHQWWVQIFKLKFHQQQHQQAGRQKNIKFYCLSIVNINPNNRFSSGNRFSFDNINNFSQKTLVG